VAGWADERLDAAARGRVARARARAYRALVRRAGAAARGPLDAVLGIPGRAALLTLVRGFGAALLGDARA